MCDEKLKRLRTEGFEPLKEGMIHMRCPKCGRKMSNVDREEGDHPGAWLIEVPCPNTGCETGMEPECPYFDRDGNQVFLEDDDVR